MITLQKNKRLAVGLLLAILLLVSVCATHPVHAASTTDIAVGGQQYYLTSVKYPGRAVNMYVDSTAAITNKTPVNLYALDKSTTQRFTFVKNTKGNYLMIPYGSKYTVNVSALQAGTAVFAWQNKAVNNEYFIIEKTSDGYYTMRMENATGLYLTADSNSKLTLRAKAADNSQKFAFHPYPETTPETDAATDTATDAANDAANVTSFFTEGNQYYFTSVKYSGRAINMSVNKNSAIKNNTKVNLYALDKSETQRFTFKKNSAGQYLMVPSGTSYTVNVNKLSAGCKVIAYKNQAKNNEYLIVERTAEGYYMFRLANKPSLYLTATSKNTLTFKKKTSGTSQQFKGVDYSIESTIVNITKNLETSSLTLGVKHLMQTDKRWKKISYDPRDKNATIGTYGCLVTSMTMVYNYRHNTTYTPVTYAKKRMKFDGNGYANGGDYKKLKKVTPFSCKTIKKYIDSGYPLIIFGRTKKNAGATHYAVVYGYTNGATSAKYCKLYDPASKKRTTVSHFLKTYKHNGKLYILKD
ncbi:MAG: C39 family peptidase [Lachnospiraceae bacterium]|nr:C39 family peptidase [Lachnospiraceae bacterium]